MEVEDSGSATLSKFAYYADGTMRIRSGGGITTGRYYYDGDQEIAEYNSSWPVQTGAIQRRYVRLPGSVDIPMIDYTGSCGTGSCEHWALQDRRGSVVATTDENGDIRDQYKYSAYGESGPEGDTCPYRLLDSTIFMMQST